MKSILSALFFLISASLSFGQYILPASAISKIKDSELLLRWEPQSLEEWRESIQAGYLVEIFTEEGKGQYQLIKSEVVLPATEMIWEQHINRADTFLVDFYQGSKDLLYANSEVMRSELSGALEGDATTLESVDSLRLGFLVYSATYDFKIAELAGLAFKFPIDKNKQYLINISCSGKPDFNGIELKVDPNKSNTRRVPKLIANFGDKEVTLKWRTRDLKSNYFGYYLESSKDGKHFQKPDRLPFVNVLDDNETEQTAFQQSKEKLVKNYKTHWYRLKGMDYFGEESILYSEAKGYGYDRIPAMPTITYADQIDSNYAFIKWKVDPILNRLIDEFQVWRSDEMDGDYEVVKENMPVTQREIRLKMRHTTNYYRIIMRPKDGEDISSFPVFVMGLDTLPPATPIGLVGTIDSMGVVKLSWNANTEEDLWGYKIFRSNFKESEFNLMNASPILDTFIMDTVNLRTFVEEVHYQIIALDKRNNRSPFTEILTLEKVDYIPPISPVIRDVNFMEDSIKIHWYTSSSRDLSHIQLFRKNPAVEDSWTQIASYQHDDSTRVFYDKDFELDNRYVYTMVAYDDDGLESKPAQPRSTITKSFKPKVVFEDIQVVVNKKNKTGKISWTLENPDEVEEIMIYRGKSEKDISLYKIVDANPNYLLQENLKKNNKWYYYLSPSLKSGGYTKFSDMIIVKL